MRWYFLIGLIISICAYKYNYDKDRELQKYVFAAISLLFLGAVILTIGGA